MIRNLLESEKNICGNFRRESYLKLDLPIQTDVCIPLHSILHLILLKPELLNLLVLIELEMCADLGCILLGYRCNNSEEPEFLLPWKWKFGFMKVSKMPFRIFLSNVENTIHWHIWQYLENNEQILDIPPIEGDASFPSWITVFKEFLSSTEFNGRRSISLTRC